MLWFYLFSATMYGVINNYYQKQQNKAKWGEVVRGAVGRVWTTTRL